MRVAVVGLAALMCMAAFGATEPSVFEKPSKITTVMLPPHPYNPTFKHARNCYYYPGIMVKEVNFQDEEGAHRLSLVPIPLNEKLPSCKADNAREIIIPWQKWSGYYLGKRDAAFFFDASDGTNGGMPFVAYTAFGSEMLTDSSELAERNAFRSVRMDATALVVRYRRAWLAPCSMYANPVGCWKTIMVQTGLPFAARPDCSKAYKNIPEYPTAKSMIGYEVEARATSHKAIFTALPGPVTCWVED